MEPFSDVNHWREPEQVTSELHLLAHLTDNYAAEMKWLGGKFWTVSLTFQILIITEAVLVLLFQSALIKVSNAGPTSEFVFGLMKSWWSAVTVLHRVFKLDPRTESAKYNEGKENKDYPKSITFVKVILFVSTSYYQEAKARQVGGLWEKMSFSGSVSLS